MAEHSEKLPATNFDAPFHAAIAAATGGVSPIGLSLAYTDWYLHLLFSPDKQIELATSLVTSAATAPSAERVAQDKRFRDPAWRQWPYSAYAAGLLAMQDWWQHATTGIAGVTPHHEQVVSFIARQGVDTLSPANFPFTNPLVVEQTAREGGANFIRGALNAAEDVRRAAAGAPPAGVDAFRPGREVATTPGKVIFRNRLIELIQYAPTTAEVYPEPVLIMSAWIMKYYILDLSPADSLVRYLLDRGFSVFVISWRNPSADDRDLRLDDYRQLGFMAALDAVNAVVPGATVHAVGYCLGGTLLTIAAAALARDGDRRPADLTLFAAQTDFSEPGELSLFIDDEEITFLSDMMAQRGYLEARQMAGAFQLLRSNDLIWSAMVYEYLMGRRPPMSDLLAWNADSTRMPYRMHAEYLRTLFLDNDLALGRFEAGGKRISLRDIDVPLFVVSTSSDHVAPWRSVFKIQALTQAETTFVLSNGGHNAGIVNPPGSPGRQYQLATHAAADTHVDPDAWQAAAKVHAGSWWPAWSDWLVRHSGPLGAAPTMGAPKAGYAPLCDAPGTYVLQT